MTVLEKIGLGKWYNVYLKIYETHLRHTTLLYCTYIKTMTVLEKIGPSMWYHVYLNIYEMHLCYNASVL